MHIYNRLANQLAYLVVGVAVSLSGCAHGPTEPTRSIPVSPEAAPTARTSTRGTGNPTLVLAGAGRAFTSIKWSADGNLLAGLDSAARQLVILDAELGAERTVIALPTIPDPATLTWMSDSELRIESVREALQVDAATGRVETLAPGVTAPDGRTRAEVLNDTVVIRRGPLELGRFTPPTLPREIAWASDGSYISVFYRDPQAETGGVKLAVIGGGPNAGLAFTVLDDRGQVLWAHPNIVRRFCGTSQQLLADNALFDARSGRPLTPLSVDDSGADCAWDATGRLLAVQLGFGFGGIRVIDTQTHTANSWAPKVPHGKPDYSGEFGVDGFAGIVRQNSLEFRPKHTEIANKLERGIAMFSIAAQPVREFAITPLPRLLADPRAGDEWILGVGEKAIRISAKDGSQSVVGLSNGNSGLFSSELSRSPDGTAIVLQDATNFELRDRSNRLIKRIAGVFIGWDRARALSLSNSDSLGTSLIVTDVASGNEISHRRIVLAFSAPAGLVTSSTSRWSTTAEAGIVCDGTSIWWLGSITAAPTRITPGFCGTITFANDGRLAAFVYRNLEEEFPKGQYGTRNHLLIVDMKTGKITRKIDDANLPVFRPQTHELAYGGTNDTHLLDIDKNQDRIVGKGKPLGFSSDGAVLALQHGELEDASVAFVSLKGDADWETPKGLFFGVDVTRGIVGYTDGAGVRFVRRDGKYITLVNVGDEWVAYDAQGRFDGPERAYSKVHYRLGDDRLRGELVPADQLLGRMHVAGLVKDFFAGKSRLTDD